MVKGKHGRVHFWRFAGWVWVVHWLHLGLGWHTRFAFGASEVGWLGGWHIDFSLDLVGRFSSISSLPSFLHQYKHESFS